MNAPHPSLTSLTATAAIVRQAGAAMSIETIEVTAPREDEIRVRIAGVGICHTDLVCRDSFPVPLPIVLGHEGAGVVEAVGPQVKTLKPGDHVILSFNSCGHCANCDSHQPAYCHDFFPKNFGGVRLEDGTTALSQHGQQLYGDFFGQSSFASIAMAREKNAVRVDKDLPLALLGPLGCGIQTGAGAVVNSLRVRPDSSFIVFGAGAVGMAAIMAAKVVGASCIIAVEPHAERRQLALSLGATAVFDPAADAVALIAAIREASGGGVAYALDTTGKPAVMAMAAELLLSNGMLGLVGVSPADVNLPINIMSMMMRGIGIKAILEGDSDPQVFIPELVQLFRDGRFPFDRLIKTFPFDQINQAADAAESGAVIKPVLIF